MTASTEQKRSAQAYIDQAAWHVKHLGRRALHGLKHFPSLSLAALKHFFMGFAILFGRWKDWVTAAEQTADINANRALARKQGLQFDTRITDKRDKLVAFRQKETAVLVALLGVLAFVAYAVYGDHPLFPLVVGAGLFGVAAVLEEIGRRHVPPSEDGYEARPVTPLEPGISYRKLQASIKEILAEEVKPPIDITFHGNTILEHGIEFEVHLTQKLTDDHLRTLERHLQAGRNMVSVVHNRENTAAPILRVFWRDPLAGAVTPERRPPRSLTCTEPFYLTRDDTGGRPAFNVLGLHQFWAGRSGSGKSSAIWTLLDWLVDCADAEVDGIDITNGPVFGAYKKVMHNVAYTEEDAHAILDEAIELAMQRNIELEQGMDADDDGLMDENYVVSDAPGKRARFIIIDEYSTFAQKKDLRLKAERLYEVGRKARVHIIASSPAADKKGLGDSTVPVNQSMVKVIFGVPFAMIPHLLGTGATDDGWRPDRFEPATAQGPGDSGKCYVHSPDFGKPVIQRFDRLTIPEIRERNRDRRAYSTSHSPIPEALQILQAAFAKAGNPSRLPTATILEHPLAAGWDAIALASALRECPVVVAPKPMAIDGKTARGYELAGVQAAIKAVK